MSKLQLYVDAHYTSPYAMSVYVALLEKGLPFELNTVNLETGENLSNTFPDTSITSRVPTLIHDGFALSESSAITEYLEELYPEHPLYPASAQERARARQVQAWLRSDLMPIRQERSTLVVFYRPDPTPLSDAAVKAADKLFFAADKLLGQADGNLCSQWCIADVDLALMLNRLLLNGDPVPEHLAAYARRQWQRPSVQQWVQMQRPPL